MMRIVRQSVLLVAILSLFLITSSFNASTQDQSDVQYKHFSSYAAVLLFLNMQAENGIDLENLQVTAAYDGVLSRFGVFYRELPGQGAVQPWTLSRFAVNFTGLEEDEAIMDAANYTQTFLNYVGGDISEPHLALRHAAIAVHSDERNITFEVFHRADDRGDPATYGWEWFRRFGDRELSTLLQLLNGEFQENPRAFYPGDILSMGLNEIDEHIYFNFYQLGMTGSAVSTSIGWGAQSFTNPDSVVDFLNQQNPEEYRVSADYDEIGERFRVFWR